jgi:catalase
MENKKKLTNAAGIPYYNHEDSQTVGSRGPFYYKTLFYRRI